MNVKLLMPLEAKSGVQRSLSGAGFWKRRLFLPHLVPIHPADAEIFGSITENVDPTAALEKTQREQRKARPMPEVLQQSI